MSKKSEKNSWWGKDCPEGMVQVEFVGCSPDYKTSDYGWKPVKSTFIEVYVDGDRFRIQVGDFESTKGKRRGLHIVTDKLNLIAEKSSMNAVDLFFSKKVAQDEDVKS